MECRRLIAAQHHGYPAHPLAANETNFDPRLVGLDGDDRCDAGLHEIDRFDPSIGSFQVFEKRHRHLAASEAATMRDRLADIAARS